MTKYINPLSQDNITMQTLVRTLKNLETTARQNSMMYFIDKKGELTDIDRGRD